MFISEERRGSLEVLLAGAMWGGIGMFVTELAACGSTPALTGFLRMAFGFIIVAPIAAARHSLRVDRQTLLACALLGLLSHAPFNVCYNLSVELNGVALAAVLLYSAPVFTAIASRLLFSEKFSRRKLLALAVNILGCLLAVTGGDFVFSHGEFSLSSALWGLGAGFFYGMIPILGKMAGKHANPFAVSAWSYFFAAVALLAVTRPPLLLLGQARLTVYGLLYGLFSAALPYLFYYAGVQRIRETSRVPVLASIELVVAALLGVALYHESIGAANLAGIVLVLLSIVMMRE